MLSPEVTESVRETMKSAARKLTGFRRRQFQAEVTLRYCQGSSRRAERAFGWARETVKMGLHELRSGIRCVENFSARGRVKTEQQHPELVPQIEAMVEPESQADPKFQTPLAFTRMTAKAVHKRLAEAAGEDGHVPAERTVFDILNRLGYRLRSVRKAKPQKKSPRPTPSSTICGKSIRRRRRPPKRSASRWIPKRR